MVRRIVDLAERQLQRMPESGHPGRLQKTRELVVTSSPYFVSYRVIANRIEILRVISWRPRLAGKGMTAQ